MGFGGSPVDDPRDKQEELVVCPRWPGTAWETEKWDGNEEQELFAGRTSAENDLGGRDQEPGTIEKGLLLPCVRGLDHSL